MCSARTLSAPLLLVLTFVAGCTDPAPSLRGSAGGSAGATAGASASAAPPATSARADLTGAGASFPYPLYAEWFNEYAQQSGIRINYRSVGSANGIRELLAKTVDFGATDVPMSDAEVAAARTSFMHVPTALGAVAITYNLPSLKRPLRLSGDVIADVFLGRITRWNDARIVALNPGAPLTADSIRVVHRADGSGTSYILSDYLASVSTSWARSPGRGRDVAWPVGTGESGNEGVAGSIKQSLGSIGYLEVVYARQNHLRIAHVQNAAGRFVSPMPFEIASASTSALGTLGQRMGTGGAASDLRLSIVNATGEQAYPIASFTWMLISPSALGPVKTRQLADFLRWALLDGGDTAARLGYVALPTEAATHVLDALDATIAAQAAGK